MGPRLIVTAAHCVENLTKQTIRVYAGAFSIIGSDGKELKVTKIVVHPEFYQATGGAPRYDVGIVFVEDIRFNNYIQPSCFPSKEDSKPEDGDICVIAGWGASRSAEYYQFLQKGVIRIFDDTQCKRLIGSRFRSEQEICAGRVDGSVDSCHGDSGGPLMCYRGKTSQPRWTIEGIVSWGAGFCGAAGSPGVYQEFLFYKDWILQEARKYNNNLQ